MKEIGLTKEKVAIVDDCDWDLAAFNWSASDNHGRQWYAKRWLTGGKKEYMHRAVARRMFGEVVLVDHINGDGLDNRRENLRVSSRSLNAANSIYHLKSYSQYRGVHWNKRLSKWRTQCRVNGKLYHLGLWDDEKRAAEEYNYFAEVCFGDYAKLNEIKKGRVKSSKASK